jgi:hypothetical protein
MAASKKLNQLYDSCRSTCQKIGSHVTKVYEDPRFEKSLDDIIAKFGMLNVGNYFSAQDKATFLESLQSLPRNLRLKKKALRIFRTYSEFLAFCEASSIRIGHPEAGVPFGIIVLAGITILIFFKNYEFKFYTLNDGVVSPI